MGKIEFKLFDQKAIRPLIALLSPGTRIDGVLACDLETFLFLPLVAKLFCKAEPSDQFS